MALPTRGQHDWDDELNNEIQRLDSDVQSAVADAVSAKADAAYAKAKADEAVADVATVTDSYATQAQASASDAAASKAGADNAQLAAEAARDAASGSATAAASSASDAAASAAAASAPTDTRIANLVGDSTSSTATALNAAYVRETRPEDYGAMGDGITDDTPALQAMFDALRAADEPALVRFKALTYYLASELQVCADNTTIDARGAVFLGPTAGTPQGGLITIVDRDDLTRTVRWVTWVGGTVRPQHAADNGLNVVAAEHVTIESVKIDMSIAGQRGMAIQSNETLTASLRHIDVINCEAVGGLEGFEVGTSNVDGRATDIRFSACRAVGCGKGFRVSANNSAYSVDRVVVDGAEVVDCDTGFEWRYTTQSAITNSRVSGVTYRGVDAAYFTDGQIDNLSISASGTADMGLALSNGSRLSLSNVILSGAFGVAIYNGMGDVVARGVTINGATLGIQNAGAVAGAVYSDFLFENVGSKVNSYRSGDAYLAFAERSGSVVVDASRSHQPSADVPVFGHSAQTNWSALSGKGLLSSGAQNASVSYKVKVGAGTYTMRLGHVKSANRGIVQVAVDGSQVGSIDAYDAATADAISEVTGIVLTGGEHTLTLTMATKNAASSGYYGGPLWTLALVRTA